MAAKKEVQAAKVPDLLGVSKAGWNNSTLSENMKIFPDRPMMRQLSKVRSVFCRARVPLHAPRAADFRTSASADRRH